MAYIDRTDSFMQSLDVEAYRVGGSVRDELLGRRPKDADYIVRGRSLGDLGAALNRAVDKIDKGAVSPLKLRDGRQAGWRVSGKGLGLIEVVLPRTEIPRAPAEGENTHRAFEIVVDETLDLTTDAERRDFTFNALYKNVGAGGIVDPTEKGLYDLQHKLIRTTHPDSFRDDPLRTLRALRFVSTLGYDLTADTVEQMTRHASAVTGLSAKGYASGTVLEELSKLLMGRFPAKALRLARDTGVLAVVLPELAPMIGFEQGSRYHDLTTDEHTFVALDTAAHVDAPLRVRMALLFHDAGKPEAAWTDEYGRKHYYATKIRNPSLFSAWIEDDGTTPVPVPLYITTEDHEVIGARIWDAAAGRLNAERKLRNDVRALILNHMVNCVNVKATKVNRERVRLGDSMLRDLYMMRMCDLSGKGNANMRFLQNVAELEAARSEAQELGVPAAVGDLCIDGNDVMALGASGRDVGRILAAVLDEVAVDPSNLKLTRDWQLRAARRLK